MRLKIGLLANLILFELAFVSLGSTTPRIRSTIDPPPDSIWEIVGKDGQSQLCALVNNRNIAIRRKGKKYVDVKMRLREIRLYLNDTAILLSDNLQNKRRIIKIRKEQRALKKIKAHASDCKFGKPTRPDPIPDQTPFPAETPTPAPTPNPTIFVPPTAAPSPTPIFHSEFSMEPYEGAVDRKVIRYLLEKAAYGLSSTEEAVVNAGLSQGIGAAVDELMRIKPESSTLASRIEDRKDASNFTGSDGLGNLSTQSRDGHTFRGFRHAVLDIGINTRNPFRENLRHFLLGLWTVGHDVLTENPAGNPQRVLWWEYFELLKEIAYNNPLPDDLRQEFPHKGKFATQLVRVGRHPTMLLYLSNNQNVRGTVNENYARELLELFSLGTERYDETLPQYIENYVEFRNGGNRTLGDIFRIARNLSGWSVVPASGGNGLMHWKGVFNPEDHDPALLPIFEGQPHEFMSSTDADVVFGIFEKHPGTRQYIAKQLLKWYVTNDPPFQLIKNFGEVLHANAYDLDASLSVLLKSKAFYHPKYINTIIKNSFQVAVEFIRILELARHDIGDQELEVGVSVHAREGTPDNEFIKPYNKGGIARMGYTTTQPSDGVFFFPENHFARITALIETANFAASVAISNTEHARLLDQNGRRWLPQRVLPEGDYSSEEVIQYIAERMGVELNEDAIAQLDFYMNYDFNGVTYTRRKYDNLLNGIPSEHNGQSSVNHQKRKALWVYAMLVGHPNFLTK